MACVTALLAVSYGSEWCSWTRLELGEMVLPLCLLSCDYVTLFRRSSASANGSHHFHEGQRCDETGTGRSSEAVFKICSKGSEQAEMAMQVFLCMVCIKMTMMCDAPQEGEPAYIENIQEPSLCTYKFNMSILPVNEPKTFGNNATCLGE